MAKNDPHNPIEIMELYHYLGIYFIEELKMPIQEKQESKFLDHISYARTIANECKNLEMLRDAVHNFNGCASIKSMSQNTVFSDGNPNSNIMLIGEAPGESEDIKGIPFCGRSGALLDKMLEAISLNRTKVYITNTIFWRPPGNRPPTNEELQMCLPFLEKHIAIISPKLLVLVGSSACKALMNTSISQIRGSFTEYSNQYTKQTVTTTGIFHPAYLLRQASKKVIAWQDLQMIQKFLNNNEL